MSRLLENLLIFGRVLRRAGIDVHPGRLLDVIEALEQVNLGARDDVYYTCRTLLVHRREQIPIFDRAFTAFWRAQSAAAVRDGSRPDRSRPSAVEIEDVLAPEVLASDELASMADAGDEERGAQTRDGLKIWGDAVAAVSRLVPDWSGGTRIGGAVKQFHQRWGRRVLNGGPVVLLISDGWDRGDPGELAEQVARLQRSCHRLVWLNPLIGTADYAPLTRGLQAALPFVDDFLPARTLTNLVDLAAHLNALR